MQCNAEQLELIVPFPPGGGTDIIGRIIANGFSAYNMDVVVINKPGAEGVIGTEQVVKSAADGKTMLLTGTSFLFNKLNKNSAVTYDLDSLDHIFIIGWSPNYLYARSDLRQKTLKEILATTKKNPNAYNWGVTNAGAEFTVRLIEKQMGVKLNVIAYRGTAQGITDLIGKNVDLVIDGTPTPLIKAAIQTQRIRVVGSTESKSQSNISFERYIPNIRTSTWFGISFPKNTPEYTEAKINMLLNDMVTNPEIKEKLEKNDIRIVGGDLKKFPSWIHTEEKRYDALSSKR
jgi:tripartite-type tricarboxylate transporter receptor subunit TctC